jgi:hypothetical protein
MLRRLIYRCCGLSSAISKEGYEQRLISPGRLVRGPYPARGELRIRGRTGAPPKQYAARFCNVSDPRSAYALAMFVADVVKPATILLVAEARVFRAVLTRRSTLALSLPPVDN